MTDYADDNDTPQPTIKKPPPMAGTVAGRVPAPAVADEGEDPASPGAVADERKSESE